MFIVFQAEARGGRGGSAADAVVGVSWAASSSVGRGLAALLLPDRAGTGGRWPGVLADRHRGGDLDVAHAAGSGR